MSQKLNTGYQPVEFPSLKRLRFLLQRAIMQIAVMEQQTSPPAGGSKTPPGGGGWAQRTCSTNWSSAASNVKKAKANRVRAKHTFQCQVISAIKHLCALL